MKILYLSCHSILEYDEVKLLSELGHEVFSHGAYTNPKKPGDPKRPGIDIPFNDELYNLSMAYGKENLHEDMIDWADAIIVMHRVDWIQKNWNKLHDKLVIWRSIGQSTLWIENKLRPYRQQGVKIVRYSPKEATIPGYVGGDAMIRFYKDPEEFGPWHGKEKKVITIGQSMKARSDFCGYDYFEEATRGLPRFLIGPRNDDVTEMDHGQASYEGLKNALRNARAYFYTGTYPASYTLNFMEAWITGIPVVAVGKKLGSSPYEKGQDTYEVPDLIKNGKNGFYSDDIQELRNYVKVLLDDHEKAKKIGQEGRRSAVKHFGKSNAEEGWNRFLKRQSTKN